ncbi:hypothetical protein G5V59_12525 [Nocardioides sp. W3-2-3]|uniref:hypothetical protein n=1 Tax=Nocardioides convexus TaxID=2712224 RepID=UPI0024187F34|nr:hypothetical protein [Nocardioides convexus]NHA00568.1 hypothetical protein [Nocardioides convexus]
MTSAPLPPPVPDGIAPRRPLSWREALDRLEAHAERAEEMIGGEADPGDAPWLPPTDLGPIPDEFVPRARQPARPAAGVDRGDPGDALRQAPAAPGGRPGGRRDDRADHSGLPRHHRLTDLRGRRPPGC